MLDPSYSWGRPAPGARRPRRRSRAQRRRVAPGALSLGCNSTRSCRPIIPTWPPVGVAHLEALGQFFDRLRRAPVAEAEVTLADDGQAPPGPAGKARSGFRDGGKRSTRAAARQPAAEAP